MEVFTFEAIGTKWHITVDGKSFTDEIKENILTHISSFENQFSRFIEENEATQFRYAKAGSYRISQRFVLLLKKAKEIFDLTEGRYDPSVGRFLELAGYDQEYSFEEKSERENFRVPSWSVEGTMLTINGPIVFDFGGIGKGFCIDKVAHILSNFDYQYYLVEAGGDMYGTTKSDGSGWRVALEWPNQEEKVFGTVELKNQAIAVSDSYRRSWKNWHHIVDLEKRQSIKKVLSCVALSKTAFDADCTTSGLFLAGSPDNSMSIAEAFESEYIVFQNDNTVRVSQFWPGELF